MKLAIAHRGNINGRIKHRENSPDYIVEALNSGFDVEVDVWYVNSEPWLGHDIPQYHVDSFFLSDPRLWIHCKNIEAMEALSDDSSLNIFAHDEGIVITTQGFLWSAPGEKITKKSIAVMPELVDHWYINDAYGVCTDFPSQYNLSK